MTNATSSPGVSTTPKTLRPFTFLPASQPLVAAPTVEAPRTLRASTTEAEGSTSHPCFSRTRPRSRSQMRSEVPSLDQVRW